MEIGLAGETHTTMPSGAIAAGSLGENGTWGGRANPSEVYLEDGQSSGTASGQTIKCTKESIGEIKESQHVLILTQQLLNTSIRFVSIVSDGTIVTNSGEINRGFKAGYAINSTGGLATLMAAEKVVMVQLEVVETLAVMVEEVDQVILTVL